MDAPSQMLKYILIFEMCMIICLSYLDGLCQGNHEECAQDGMFSVWISRVCQTF
jgi:hypothetical protein